jgi:hypothetical protein
VPYRKKKLLPTVACRAQKNSLSICHRLSGGDDMAHGNQTVMEGAFNGGEAIWEINRYVGVQHGYTVPGQEAYNLNADVRSSEIMLSSFEELMAVPQIVASTPTSIGVPTATSSTPSA